MVVFQYGSIVLFNVRDHEIDGYLKIVERHSSGLLPEMRKDGKISHNLCFSLSCILQCPSLTVVFVIYIPLTCNMETVKEIKKQ